MVRFCPSFFCVVSHVLSSCVYKVDATEKQASVQDYYGSKLQTSDDLQTNACCTSGKPPKHIQECLDSIHQEVKAKYYGCGLCLPEYDLKGKTVLDLGCGAGRDVYIASQLVGASGQVTGIDMTDEQLEVARRHQSYHAKEFGFENVQFEKGYLEQLDQLDSLQPNSFDLIISNCVINLVSDKAKVLKDVYALLKPGGEFYFSDVYCSRRISKQLQDDPVLWGECLSGALYWNDFENLAQQSGFTDVRLYEDAPITIQNPAVQEKTTGLEFYSATYRLWKLDSLEPDCEDYGQAVVYKGTLDRYPEFWKLDAGHVFETGKMHTVCGNTYNMLFETSLKDHFEFYGNWDKHYGIFEGCGRNLPYGSSSSKGGESVSTSSSSSGCC